MMNLHPALAAEATASAAAGMTYTFHGTALVWQRDGWALSWAGERQTLPNGSTPLQVNGGTPICGQGWTAEEVQQFGAIVQAPVVYEYRMR